MNSATQIQEERKRYKSDQRFFSDLLTKMSSSLDQPFKSNSCTRPQLSTKVSSETKPETSIKELTAMANRLADNMHTTRMVPDDMRTALSMLLASLAGRRRCAKLWRAESSKDGKDRSSEDHTHKLAIADPEKIRATLEKAMAFAAPNRPSKPTIPSRPKETGFSQHGVLSGDEGDAMRTPTPGLDVQPSGKDGPTEYDSFIMEGLKGLDDIRLLVRAKWRDHKAGISNLYDTTKFVQYATAISCGDVAKLQAYCGETTSLCQRVERLSKKSGLPGADRLFCMRASKILALFREYIVIGKPDCDLTRARKIEIVRECEAYHVLASNLCAAASLLSERAERHRKGELLYEQMDPLLLMVLELFNLGEVTFEATVVLELYLEMYDPTDMASPAYFQILEAAAKTVKGSLEKFDKTTHKSDENLLKGDTISTPGQICRRIVRQVTALAKALPFEQSNRSPETTQYKLLTHFPFFCGSIYTSLIENFYLDGIEMCRHDSRVTATAHLYRATRIVGRSQTWTQLERFVTLQGRDTLSLQGAVDNTAGPRDAATELGMALGIPTQDFAASKALEDKDPPCRLSIPYIASAGTLALPEVQVPLLRLEHDTALPSGKSGINSPQQSRQILQKLAKEIMGRPHLAAAHADIRGLLAKNKALDSVQLLSVLSMSLAEGSPHLESDYHRLALSCWKLLAKIESNEDYKAAFEINRQFFWMEDTDSRKLIVVDEILWEAVSFAIQVPGDHRRDGASWGDLILNTPILRRIVPDFDKFIRERNSSDATTRPHLL